MFRLIFIIAVAILLLMAGVASARERAERPGMAGRPMIARPIQRQGAPPRQEAARPPEPPANHPAPPPAGGPARNEAPNAPPEQRAGRLTPDERKALRRQIDEARDFYRPFPQRRP